MTKSTRGALLSSEKDAQTVRVGDTVWFPRHRVNTIPSGARPTPILKGIIEHIEPVHGTTCLVSFEVGGDKFSSTIVTRSLWLSKRSLMAYMKSLNDFRPGDLIHVAQNQYNKSLGTYEGMSTSSGIVVKTSRQSPFLQLQTESGVITAHKDYCIVLSRQSDESLPHAESQEV